MVKFSKDNYLIILFSIIYLAVGLYTYKDYGLGIEEHFQRSSGFYWLNYLLQFTNFENFSLPIIFITNYNSVCTYNV